MSTDEPRHAKYGLPDSESHRIVERHFKVMAEQQAIDLAVLDEMTRMAARGIAALGGAVPQQTPTVSATAPQQAPAVPLAAPVPPPAPAPDKLLGLRAQLGLS